MPFNEIGNITIDGNDPGKAYEGHIYSCNISIGNSSEPTKLTVNIVHENGVEEDKINLIKKDIDELPLKKINIGDLDDIYMHLIKYEVRRGIGSSVLTLEYVDGSVILDKIFIGLINRHASKKIVADPVNGEEVRTSVYGLPHISGISEIKDGITSYSAKVEMSVNCLECDGSDKLSARTSKSDGIYDSSDKKIVDSKGKALPPINRDIDAATPAEKLGTETDANFFFIPRNKKIFKANGGAIIMGRENFVENECDVPDVDYTFHDLLESFNSGFISLKTGTLTDKTYENGYTPYRRDYTGTLREVLNAWCSDFGYSFTWNIYKEDPEVIGISLTTALTSIKNIKTLVSGIKSSSADKTVVESAVESYSKEGTYKKSYISQYVKGSRVKESNQKKYAVKTFYNITPELIMQPAEWGFRKLPDFIAHSALAKFNSEIRKSVLWGGRHYSTLGFTNISGGNGVTILTSEQKNAIVAEWTFDEINSIIDQYGEDFHLSVGYYNQDIEKYWEEFDRSIAEGFLGRYYFRPVLKGELDEKGCITRAAFNHTTNMVGGGDVKLYEWTNPNSCFRFPYGKFIVNASTHQSRLGAIFPYLRKAMGDDNLKQDAYPPEFISRSTGQVIPSYQVAGNIVDESLNYRNGIWIFEREAAWGSTTEEITNKFTRSDGSSAIQHLLPSVLPLEGRALNMFNNLLSKMGGTLDADVTSGTPQRVLIVGPSNLGSQRAISNCYIKTGSTNFVPDIYDDARFEKKYFPQVTANYNEKVSLSVQDAGSVGTGEGAKATAQDCITICESSVIEQICGTCEIDNEVNRPYVGFNKFAAYDGDTSGNTIPKGTIAEYFSVMLPRIISRKNSGMYVVLPSMMDYQGYLELASNTRITVDGAKDVYGLVIPLGDKNNPKTGKASDSYINKTLGIQVVENNITNDVDQIINPADNQSIVNMLVPKNLKTQDGKGNLKSITPLDYHKEIEGYFSSDKLGIGEPQEQYSFSIAGLKFKEVGLSNYITPEKGLRSMSISYDEKGITTSFVFSTRPAVLPSPQIFMKSLGPKLNTYGR